MTSLKKLQNTELFLKNTAALFEVDQPLAYALRALNSDRYEYKKNPLNFYDKLHKCFVYEDEKAELARLEAMIYPECSLYPVLFFYGFGNAKMIYEVLGRGQKVVVFESHLELLCGCFASYDFSEALLEERLLIYNVHTINTLQLDVLFQNFKLLLKTYGLFVQNDYYASMDDELLQGLNENILYTIKQIVLNSGTDVKDSLQGLEQTTKNLKTMISHPSLKAFVSQRKNKYESILIVSSGPSLAKQLPLLKQYQDRVFILAADSSYRMLACEGIYPDVVCSMERVEQIAAFFKQRFYECDKHTIFMLSSLIHEDVLASMEGRHFMLVSRPLNFSKALKLDEYGYLGYALSVAHMNYELARLLECKNIVFIGQDLAYAKDGSSHSKNHAISTRYDNDYYKSVELEAYGGEGKVVSHIYWQLFKQSFESYIGKARLNGINVYNCTQGGVRIQGAIEASFKDICKLLFKDKKPSFAPLKGGENYKKDEAKIYKRLKEFEKKARKYSLKAGELRAKIGSVKLDLNSLKALDKELLKFRKSFSKPGVILELLVSRTYQNELDLSLLEFSYYKDEDELRQKYIKKLGLIANWLYECEGYLAILANTLEKSKKDFEKDLK